MDVGEQYIVFGANTGSLYFFNRTGLRFLQLVSSPEVRAAITRICFSPDERFVALATAEGELVVLEPNLGTRAKERIVLRHMLHRDSLTAASSTTSSATATASASSSSSLSSSSPSLQTVSQMEGGVTCLTWAPRGQEVDENYLFSSDTMGTIVITPVITSLIKRSLLLATSDVLYKADSRVVQLGCASMASSSATAMKLQLIISTLTKSILLTIDTNAKQITGLQVGSKPRKGSYGACFSVPVPLVSICHSSPLCWVKRKGRKNRM